MVATSTLEELTDRVQLVISDSAEVVWSQMDVQEHVRSGIREYSKHFPRMLSLNIPAITDMHVYDLPADYFSMVSVEYPVGEEPPAYLIRGNSTTSYFWSSNICYDVLLHFSATDMDELTLSASTDAGKTIRIAYNALHLFDVPSNTTLTIPQEHEEIVIAYAIWMCWRQRLGEFTKDAGSNSNTLLLDQIASNTDRAETAYRRLLRDTSLQHEPSLYPIAWQMDKWDRGIW